MTAAMGAVSVLVSLAVARADGGNLPPYVLWHYGYFRPNMYSRDQVPPYFALHPPVYYSYPVPRTYGYSPYAYPPWIMTPKAPKPEPIVVPNKFVPSKDTRTAKGDQVVRTPLRMTNPYVARTGGHPAPERVMAAAD